MRFVFSAGVFVYRYKHNKREFLFLKHKDHFDIPKGLIDGNEHARQAALREADEETGLKLELDPFYKDKFEFIRRYHSDQNIVTKKTVTVFLSKVKPDAKVRISWEHDDFVWHTLDDAVQHVFPYMKAALINANDYVDRSEAMQQLNKEYATLPNRIRKWELSKRFVPGEGPLNARVMFIGQAPGNNEDIQLRPFIGRSGKFLDHLINIAKLRRENVYICSTVHFFPPANRLPTKKEVELCKDFVYRQIGIIRPTIIVLLGALAASTLLGVSNMAANHSHFIEKKGVTYFISMHPSAAVRFKKNVAIMEQDFRVLRDYLKLHKN